MEIAKKEILKKHQEMRDFIKANTLWEIGRWVLQKSWEVIKEGWLEGMGGLGTLASLYNYLAGNWSGVLIGFLTIALWRRGRTIRRLRVQIRQGEANGKNAESQKTLMGRVEDSMVLNEFLTETGTLVKVISSSLANRHEPLAHEIPDRINWTKGQLMAYGIQFPKADPTMLEGQRIWVGYLSNLRGLLQIKGWEGAKEMAPQIVKEHDSDAEDEITLPF